MPDRSHYRWIVRFTDRAGVKQRRVRYSNEKATRLFKRLASYASRSLVRTDLDGGEVELRKA